MSKPSLLLLNWFISRSDVIAEIPIHSTARPQILRTFAD